MRTALVILLGITLVSGPLQAQQPAFSLARAAQDAASKQAPSSTPTRTRMSPAYKWTGLGLLMGGGMLLASGILVDNACIEDGGHSPEFCKDLQTAWFTTGAVVAGAGGAVLLIAPTKQDSLPSTGFNGRRVAWRIRF
jgi:hypothetical protein